MCGACHYSGVHARAVVASLFPHMRPMPPLVTNKALRAAFVPRLEHINWRGGWAGLGGVLPGGRGQGEVARVARDNPDRPWRATTPVRAREALIAEAQRAARRPR